MKIEFLIGNNFKKPILPIHTNSNVSKFPPSVPGSHLCFFHQFEFKVRLKRGLGLFVVLMLIKYLFF